MHLPPLTEAFVMRDSAKLRRACWWNGNGKNFFRPCTWMPPTIQVQMAEKIRNSLQNRKPWIVKHVS